MENEGINFIKIATAVILGLAVVGFLVYLFTLGQGITKETDQELMGIQKSLTMAKFEQYNNSTVSGAQVISCIRSNSSKLTIKVTNGVGTTVTYDSSNPDYTVTDPGNSAYINPTGEFTSTLEVDANKTVTGITFVQK
ncbi:MAG TPA: hypothetical protein GXX73_14320 [Clostridium sp.]|nr:hypothetical protein [Clostridium sp.]